MNLDDVLASWRTQDEAPLYGVNHDLLQLVLQHERTDLDRAMRWEQWATYGVSALLLALTGFFFAAIYYDDDPRTVWDYVAAGVAGAAILEGIAALWLSRKRQAMRERTFGNSLREEIRRSLSLVDYQLSRAGRRDMALLAAAPIILASTLLYWLVIQINNNPFGWYDLGMVVFIIVGGSVWSVFDSSRRTARDLLPRRQRLRELLETLNSTE